MQVLDRCFVFANGSVLGMVSGGTLEGQGDPIPADTLIEELAGVTPTPKHYILSCDTFVPQKGLEFDAVQKWLDTEKCTFKVQFGGNGKAATLEGYLQAPSLKFGAADSTVFSFKAICKAVAFS